MPSDASGAVRPISRTLRCDVRPSQRAHALAAVKQQRLATGERAPFAAYRGEVDVPQRSAAAVEEALALHARQETDGLVEPTGGVELVWRVLLKVHPVAI